MRGITLTNYQRPPSPPFLVLFINSICNMKCTHCFYWRNLNGRDDLKQGRDFELLAGSGRNREPEPLGRRTFSAPGVREICRSSFARTAVGKSMFPRTATSPTDLKQVTQTLSGPELDLFVVELSLDGMPEFHDDFRGTPGALNTRCRLRRSGRDSAARSPPAHSLRLHRH